MMTKPVRLPLIAFTFLTGPFPTTPQDYTLVLAEERDGETRLVVHRKLHTCDPNVGSSMPHHAFLNAPSRPCFFCLGTWQTFIAFLFKLFAA
jgi:hypothetical protein